MKSLKRVLAMLCVIALIVEICPGNNLTAQAEESLNSNSAVNAENNSREENSQDSGSATLRTETSQSAEETELQTKSLESISEATDSETALKENAEAGETEKTSEIQTVEQKLSYEDANVVIRISPITANAVPENASLKVVPVVWRSEGAGMSAEQTAEIEAVNNKYMEVEQKLNQKLTTKENYVNAGFLPYDISLVDLQGNVVELNGLALLTMEYKTNALPEGTANLTRRAEVTMVRIDNVNAEHNIIDMSETGELKELTVTEQKQVQRAVYETEKLTTYALTWTDKPAVANTLTFKGSDYTVTTTYDETSDFPEDTELTVSEIEPGTEEYKSYYQQTLEALQAQGDMAGVASARFFDISFMVDGEKVEPAASVNVKIAYDESIDGEGKTGNVVHFAETGTEVLEPELSGKGKRVDSFEFTQDSFSVSGMVLANDNYYEEIKFENIGDKKTANFSSYYVMNSDCDTSIVKVTNQKQGVVLEAVGYGETAVTVTCNSKDDGKGQQSTYKILVTVTIRDFSVMPLAVLADERNAGTGGDSLIVEGSILTQEMLQYNDLQTSNNWQIVDNGYNGNTSADKILSSDGNVRVQKNVIATDVENEFLVYLSIDTKQMFEEYFRIAEYQATTSNNYHDGQLGTVVDSMTGNVKVSVTGDAGRGYSNSALFTIKDSKGNILAENVRLYWSQANNVTFCLHLSNDKWVLLGLSVKNGEHNTVQLSEEAEEYIQEEVTKAAQLQNVVDTMGENIEFFEVENSDGSVAYDSVTRQLTWIPEVKAKPATEEETIESGSNKTTTVWSLNVAELVYKVRLNVEKEGFNSCADNMNSSLGTPETYAVNQSAVLTYNDGNRIEFPVPHVRGLLYEFNFYKVDSEDDSIKLPGAEFTLTSANGKVYRATDLGNGNYVFAGIPWGNYTMEETNPPSGYQLGETTTWAVTIGYTLDLQDGTTVIDKHIHESGSQYYRWIGYYDTDGRLQHGVNAKWKISNEKIRNQILFKKVSSTNENYVLKDAKFELYDSKRNLLATLTSDDNGYFNPASNNFTSGTYYLKEIKAPSGYSLLEDEIEITVSNTGVMVSPNSMASVDSVTENGKTIYTIVVKNEALYELPSAGGSGIYWYTIGGMLFMMAAALILYKNKHREVLER